MDERVLIILFLILIIIGVIIWNVWLMVIPGILTFGLATYRLYQMRKEEKFYYDNKFKNVNKS